MGLGASEEVCVLVCVCVCVCMCVCVSEVIQTMLATRDGVSEGENKKDVSLVHHQ